jgi:hypothetical protein
MDDDDAAAAADDDSGALDELFQVECGFVGCA